MTPRRSTSLPPLLQPWAGWLSLFPDDLAATVGQLLLRLQPLVGPLRRHAARVAVEPAGIGDIVRRGRYDRLLASEWAVADALPEEFLRRAANGELLFTGPEPANSETSLRSVALFDAGPAQLGEPRLVHLAMFILLARRAELAGAQFQWGVLQEPGILHDQQGVDGVRRLLNARTHAVLDDTGLEAWDAILGDAALDCWLVGDAQSACPAQAHSRVLVRRSWFDAQLDVELVGRRRTSSLALPLPSPQDSVRLLRRPFDAPAAAANLLSSMTHSLKRAPMFGNLHQYLAVGMVNGTVTVYRVPDSPGGSTGRARNQGKLAHADAVVAACLFRKSFGTVALYDGALHFSGFPGKIFGKTTLPLPPSGQFHAVPGALRRAPAFYFLNQGAGGSAEEVLVLDKAGNLVCWSCAGVNGHVLSQSAFRVVARGVIGAFQHGDRILFAVCAKGRTDVYSLVKGQTAGEHLYPIMHAGDQFLFGEPKAWRGGKGTYALRLQGNDWLVGDASGAANIAVAAGDIVLGCAVEAGKQPGLAVLASGRLRISLLSGHARQTVIESTEPIAQASFDPVHGRLAWLGQKSGTLIVRDIGTAQAPLLRVAPRGGNENTELAEGASFGTAPYQAAWMGQASSALGVGALAHVAPKEDADER